uniref:Phosphoglucomutase n=1 Tax=Parascaris univalens TaxID=6257 RepID=A0A915BI49_PARUN
MLPKFDRLRLPRRALPALLFASSTPDFALVVHDPSPDNASRIRTQTPRASFLRLSNSLLPDDDKDCDVTL